MAENHFANLDIVGVGPGGRSFGAELRTFLGKSSGSDKQTLQAPSGNPVKTFVGQTAGSL